MGDLANNKMNDAADIAESRLGMSSLPSHDAKHMAEFMPKGMQEAGTNMHKAASQFALKAQEGDLLAAYKSLSNLTSACVACHSAYRIR
jgi:soluble cytochrome b562